MNYLQLYNAIESGDAEARREAQHKLLSIAQTTATACLELAGYLKQQTGEDPITMRSRLILSDFIGLEGNK